MKNTARRSQLPDNPVETRLRLLAFLLLIYALVGSVVSFSGWASDIPQLADWFNAEVAIQPNTAVAIACLAGAAILYLVGLDYISAGLATASLLIGGLTLFQHLSGIDLGIDRLLLFGREWGVAGTTSPGRMGKPGSTSVILLSAALMAFALTRSRTIRPQRKLRSGAVVFVLFALAISALSLLGYVFGATQLYTIPQLTTVAIQTSTFIAAIALALIISVSDVGPGKLFADPGPGGELIRRLAPAVVVVSLVLGSVTLAGGKLAFYDLAFEASIRTILEIILLLVIVWWAVGTISSHVRRINDHEIELQQLADAMPQLVWIAQADGSVTYYNARSSEYDGLPQDSDGLYDWQPIVHPDDLESTTNAWLTAVENKVVYEHEHRIRMTDGSYRWHLSRAFPTSARNGNGIRWYGTATDIEQVKRAEAELRQTEGRLQQALDAGRIGVWEYRPSTGELILDDRTRMLTGFPNSGTIDRETAERAVFESDLSLLRSQLRDAAKSKDGKLVSMDIRVRHPESGVRWLQVVGQITAPEGSSGAPILRGTSIDITDRKNNEANQNFLFSIAEVIRLTTEPSTMLQRVAELVGKYLDLDRCMFLETQIENDHRHELGSYSRNGDRKVRVKGYANYSPVTVRLIAGGQTVVVKDSAADERTADHFERSYGPNGERAYIAVPLMRNRKWSGTLWASDDRPRTWSDLEIGLLETVGERAWAAIERLRAENALRESEKRFRNVSDSAPVMIWVADTNNNGTWFNRPWLEFTGRPLEAEIGTGWLESIHPDDIEFVGTTCMSAFNERKPFTMEFRMRRADGEYRWLKDSGVPRFSADGEFLGYIGSCVDIHELKTAMESLRASEARLTLATTIGMFGMWDINYVEGKMIWSDRLFEIFGVEPTPDRWMEMSEFESLVEPRDLQRVRDISTRALETHQDYAAEYRIVKADTGETRWIDARAQNFYNDAGSVVRSVGIAHDVTERRSEQEALRLSEERLKLAQEAGGIGIWDWDTREDQTYWSERMWAIYGEVPVSEKVPNDYWLGFLHADDRERLEQAALGLLGSGEPEFHHEFRIIRKNGDVRWLETTARIDRHSDGTVKRVYGITVDITQKKNAAEQLRISEANLRLVTDSIPALVSYIDSSERYRFANRRYQEWFGVELDEVVGKPMIEVLGEEAYEVFKPKIDEALNGSAVSFDTWANYKNAGRRYVHVSYVPDRDGTGSVVGYYVLVTDLTELRRSEELLRMSEERMRILTESFTDYAIISTDVEGRIDSWNPGASNIFGHAEDEVIGKPADILFTPEDVRKGVPLREMEEARQKGRAVDERWHVRKDGSRFFATGVMAPLYVGDMLTGYAKIAADLTEKKRNAEALQRAHDEMEHRVVERTREIAAMNEVLLKEISDRKTAERQKIELLQRLVSSQEDERRRIARDLHDQLGQRLTALRLKLASLREACAGNKELALRTERLQDIAALLDSEVGFLTWELRPSAIDELGLVNAIRAFVGEWSRHFDMEIDFHSAGLADVEFRREVEIQLYRIVQEALNNVVKHAEATRVEVLFERTGNSAVLIVEDNGIGFDNGTPRPASHSPGGLGLSGMRERTELIGGSLEIDTEPGLGTSIHVRIPIEH
ncbi:MAG: PAS domain S-box protein [Pyrinomonadaceae bacterium]|nr:PAS domain S-box protein [Pyrinomonadaceae bacterium]